MELLLKMKKFWDKSLFGLRYAWKNVFFGKLRSLVLLITFILIFVVTFLIISFKPLVKEYFYHNVYEEFGDFDLVLGIDANTNSRFFSIRNLNNDQINDQIPLFQINTLLTFKDSDYVKILAGQLSDLKKLNPKVLTTELKANEIIINRYIAKKFNLKTNDQVSLQFDQKINFKVIEIVDNQGLLTNNSVFIDKDSNLQYFLNALNISGFDPNVLKNLYNIVYLDVADLSVVNEIKAINDFKTLSLEPTYNHALLEQNISSAVSSLTVIFLFVLLAVLFVLQSILAILFKKRIQDLGIIKSLGGSKGFFFQIILAEVFIYVLSGFILSLILSTFVINIGLSFLGSNLIFYFDFLTILSGLGLVLLISITVLLISYYQIHKTSAIALSKDNKLITKSISYLYLLVLVVLLLLNLFLNKNIALRAIFTVIIVLFLGFLSSKLLIQLGNLFKSNGTFKLIAFKNINQNKTIRHNLNIILMAFFAIIFLGITIADLNVSSDHYIKDFETDFLITNIYDNNENITADIRSLENVDKAEQGYLFRNSSILGTAWAIDYLFSVKSENVLDYMKLALDSSALNKLNSDEKAYIVLSAKFNVIDGYQLGDKITLNINHNYPEEEFEIAGFFEARTAVYAYTNMSKLEKYQSLAKNTIFINANENRSDLYQTLINKYQSKLYYIVDLDETLFLTFEEGFKILDYFTLIAIVLVVCFVFTIINNSTLIFEELKPIYAKMKVLGAKNSQLVLMVLKENIFLLLILLISVILMSTGIIPNIMYTFVIFKVYYPFNFSLGSFLIALIACIVIYFLSYSYYFYRLSKINLIKEIKLNN